MYPLAENPWLGLVCYWNRPGQKAPPATSWWKRALCPGSRDRYALRQVEEEAPLVGRIARNQRRRHRQRLFLFLAMARPGKRQGLAWVHLE